MLEAKWLMNWLFPPYSIQCICVRCSVWVCHVCELINLWMLLKPELTVGLLSDWKCLPGAAPRCILALLEWGEGGKINSLAIRRTVLKVSSFHYAWFQFQDHQFHLSHYWCQAICTLEKKTLITAIHYTANHFYFLMFFSCCWTWIFTVRRLFK